MRKIVHLWKRTLFLSITTLVISQSLCAQDEIAARRASHQFRIGIETGVDAFFGKTDKPAMIRENVYHYDYGYNYYGSIYDEQGATLFYLGIKPEITLNRLHIPIMCGNGKMNSFTSAEGAAGPGFSATFKIPISM